MPAKSVITNVEIPYNAIAARFAPATCVERGCVRIIHHQVRGVNIKGERARPSLLCTV